MTNQPTGLAGRYASALFDLAELNDQIDAVAQDLTYLDKMITNNNELYKLVKSPIIVRSDQERVMLTLVEKAHMTELTKKFIGVITQNRRLFIIKDIINAYHTLIAKKRGQASVEVVSARELTKTQTNQLSNTLKKVLGAKITIDTKIDSDLLGGLIVKVGSRMVDSSIRTKLSQLRLAMKGVG